MTTTDRLAQLSLDLTAAGDVDGALAALDGALALRAAQHTTPRPV